jgi:hypothetical protein
MIGRIGRPEAKMMIGGTSSLPASNPSPHSGPSSGLSEKDCQSRSALSSSEPKSCPPSIVGRPTTKTGLTQTASLKNRQRPSLSEQLSAVGSKASGITAEIRRKFECVDSGPVAEHEAYNSPLCTVPTANIYVGALRCKYPAPAYFYKDRCEFQFCHPYQMSVVHMVMYYRDMSSHLLKARHLSFHVPRRLVHFLQDYDPARLDEINLEFAAASAVDLVRRCVPELAGTAGGSR